MQMSLGHMFGSAQPAESDPLINQQLPSGWLITRALPKPGTAGAEDLTGGCFSKGYIATKVGANGKTIEAFLKIIDVWAAMKAPHGTLMERLSAVTTNHTFECNILDICDKAKMDRVVKTLDKGELPPSAVMPIPVPYILFELADGDVRKVVARTDQLDNAWRFKVLHDTAVGLQQLHSNDIAHQDLKPSNVLVYNDRGAKIGDLGRASKRGLAAQHDGFAIAGAVSYAPPEQVYGIIPPRWEDRRQGCDLYHLGSLAMFLFTGLTPTQLYIQDSALVPILPRAWGGVGQCDYHTALPVLMESFTRMIDRLRIELPDWAADEMSQILINACNPDFEQRGDPAFRRRTGSPIGIAAFVSRFDRLAKQAMIELKK